MNLRIEDIRKSLSSVVTWLSFDENTRFINDERNQITSEHGRGLAQELDVCTIKSRKLFNGLSESLEDTDLWRKRLRTAIDRDKEMKKNRNMNKEVT